MKALTGATAVLSAALLFGICVPAAHADQWNKKTVVTVNDPIQVPGHVLTPGTYVFTLANLQNNRQVVHIWTKGQQKLVDTVTTVPVKRDRAASHTIFRFSERPSGTPEALAEWFYPGDIYGQGFAYNGQVPSHTVASNAASGSVSSGS